MAACSFIDYRLGDDGVAVLTLDNPPLNLTTLVTLDKLISTCRDIAGDDKVRAVVVVGAGEKAFCAGSDITTSLGRSLHAKTKPLLRLSNCPCR